MPASDHGRWLIVGHGSVGSAISRRLARADWRPWVLDPSPRRPVVDGVLLGAIEERPGPFSYVMSCVFPSEADTVPASVREAVTSETIYFDCNTVSPRLKREIAELTGCESIDVALLDTLDEAASRPALAISGHAAERACEVLTKVGFCVDVVGHECGQAARLKFARSLFMKSLEALVVEFEASTQDLTSRDVVARSITRNLGDQFAAFARLLMQTNQLHAQRRAAELVEALEIFASEGQSVRLATAAASVLENAAQAWAAPDAPATTAAVADRARYLSGKL